MKIRIVANAHAWGGGEMSVVTIMRRLCEEGHHVVFHPTSTICEGFSCIANCVEFGAQFEYAKLDDLGCDTLFFYANNTVYHLRKHKQRWKKYIGSAARRVMCINFEIGYASDAWFRQGWHQILFLNSTRESEFPHCQIPLHSLAPCVDLGDYLHCKPDYGSLRFMRHSKWFKHCEDMVRIGVRVRHECPTISQHYMAAPPGLMRKFPKDSAFGFHKAFAMPVHEFLDGGSAYWYRLDRKMRDQGPRVIVEAMAAGLPCIVDNRDGAKDRVTSETGWRCDSNDDYVAVAKLIASDPSILVDKGAASRKRAVDKFRPENWIEIITNSSPSFSGARTL